MFSFSTQFENLGDCVINECLLKEVARYQHVLILGHRLPEWLVSRVTGKVTICRSRMAFASRVIQLLSSGQPLSFLFKPGHMVCRKSFLGQVRVAAVSAVMSLLSGLGCRVLRFGTSVDTYGPVERLAQSSLGKLHAAYGVRDLESLELAQQLGITNACLTPDLAFMLPFTDSENARSEIAVSFRSRPWMEGEGEQQLLSSVQRLASQFSLRPVVIEQVRFDRDVSDRMQRVLKSDIVRFEGTQESCDAVFGRYEHSKVLLSNRLHSLLFSWSRGAIPVPVVDRNSDRKIIGLYDQYGLSDLVIDAESIGTLHSRVTQILTDAGSVRARLSSVFEREGRLLREILRKECSHVASNELCATAGAWSHT
ncbi:MAG: polysaccharide pyruvyl transferase family protein [Planctomycetaceae bacterium]|nr:polysaccharide pyruvyl transferase family protein [Planctomycetaceae bacterium]